MLTDCDKVPNKKATALRKQASDFAFAVFDSVDMINAEHWNSLVREGNEYMKLDYLRVLENNPPQNMRFHYSLIYEGKRPVAIASFQVIDFSAESFGSLVDMDESPESCSLSGYIRKHLTNHLKKNAGKLSIRLLICGNACISGEHGFAFAPDVDRKKVFDALADVIYRISRAEKLRGKIAAVLVKDFYEASRTTSDELKEFRYHDFLVEPNMIVNLQWSSLEEYLAAMSKKYRNRAKTIMKKGAGLIRKEMDADDIIANKRQLLQLFNNVHHKAKFRMASIGMEYFAGLSRENVNGFRFTGYYQGEKLVGFRTTFFPGSDAEAHFIGLDYKINKELELYQNMLYDYIREAIAAGSKRLILGRTASEIKSTLGAEAHELVCYIRHRNPLSNRIIRPFIDYLRPSEWVPRNPFRENGI